MFFGGAPGFLVVRGWYFTIPKYIGIKINHEIRIPINQPGFNGMSFTVWFTLLILPNYSRPKSPKGTWES